MASSSTNRLTRLFAEAKRAVAFDHPQLEARLADDAVVIEGTFTVSPRRDGYRAHGAIAQYGVRMKFPAGFPAQEPKVNELHHAFPHTAEYHCNPNGDCCICVYETWRAETVHASIADFLDGPVRNFFLSQFIRQETGEWPFGEWEHGAEGYLAACADRLGCTPSLSAVRYLLRVLSKDWPKGHWDCPCGSGKMIRQCCSESLRASSKKVRQKEARAMLARLERFYPDKKNAS